MNRTVKLCFFFALFNPLACLGRPTVEVRMFDAGAKHPHHAAVKKLLLTETQKFCPGKVTVSDSSLFDHQGNFDSKNTLKSMKMKSSAPKLVFHFSWNDRMGAAYQDFERELAATETPIVASAGENVDDANQMLKLEETVMGAALLGKTKGFIIGELNEKGHLAPRSNFGKELFTALKNAGKFEGSSFSAPLFTSRLACALSDRNWSFEDLKIRKSKSVSPYPTLDELFPKTR